jgi:DNA-binding NtrC family response regulator
MRDLVSRLFTEAGYEVALASDGQEGLEAATNGDFDLAILDMSLPKMNGLEVLASVKQIKPDLPVIMITAYGSTRTAIDALRLGAYDYITKPFDLDELQVVAERALERKRLIDDNRFLRSELKRQYGFDNIIGTNREVQQAYVVAAKVARTNATVLLLGETGTGKEYLARTIHYQSDRANGPFVKVNCAALPENLLESELFGHEKGAFTHAITRRLGRFEIAHKGTIFLDEIGEIAPSVQTKLLRVLQEKQFERVGGSETITVDVRVIAATNRDLEQAVREKQFRDDLYYRLNVISVKLPPLRERGDDVMIFADHFLKRFADEMGKPIKNFSEEAISVIKAHSWPGNIRELENAVERAVILCEGDTIRPEHLMIAPCKKEKNLAELPTTESVLSELPVIASLREVECAHIRRVLNYKGWNQSAAAQILGIDRKTLRNKIKEFKLTKTENNN